MSKVFQLIEARKQARLSQRQLADRAGISHSTISRFESGKITRLENIKAIEEALHVGTEDSDKEALLDENAHLRLKLAQVREILEAD